MCRIVPSTQTLVLFGEIDLSTVAILTDACNELTASCIAGPDAASETQLNAGSVSKSATAFLDVAGLVFIDAAGLAVLVGLHHSLAAAGYGLRAIHPSSRFRRLSAFYQLDGILGVGPVDPSPRDSRRPTGGGTVIDSRRSAQRVIDGRSTPGAGAAT